jgi:hypothetical protein
VRGQAGAQNRVAEEIEVDDGDIVVRTEDSAESERARRIGSARVQRDQTSFGTRGYQSEAGQEQDDPQTATDKGHVTSGEGEEHSSRRASGIPKKMI